MPERASICQYPCDKHILRDDPFRMKLPAIVDEILKTMEAPNSADHVGYPMIPSQTAIEEIVCLLQTILYPGYFGDQQVDRANLPFCLGDHLNRLYRVLSVQIARCLMHECGTIRPLCTECGDIGKSETFQFLEKIPKLREILATDLQAAYDGDPAAKSLEEIVFSYPGLYAVTIYRAAHELHIKKIPLLPRMLTEYAHVKTGIDIHPGATLGPYFFIDHGTGVVIGETAIIGSRVRIYQGVTIGAHRFPRDEAGNLIRDTKRHPTIEDDVIIYAGATILGGETVIGKGSVIGGNVWLTRSVPPYSRVIIDSPEPRIDPIQER